ncbi:hypothetical protein LC065_16900 [Halobacillus litoralis]|uniref:hypothetical protein n=1 Tax=Halobacillus litoralis TaxID=45668 RepID=UPI001CFDD989|nr:hypothetical protein [Halobacillus litoralis]WLR47180.1 hypothetical protein LC065_16900 [Halobacillus litoralis]
MKNVLSKKALTGAIALAIAIPGISYASSTSDAEVEANVNEEVVESGETEIRSLLQSFKDGELTEDEVVEKLREQKRFFFHKGNHHFEEIDEETKQKLEAIKEQVEAGELTKEEAREQIEELGIKHPHPKGFKPMLDNLTEEQRTALEDIHEKVKSGELTKEEARAEMEALGLDFFPRDRPQESTEEETAEETDSSV